MVKVPIKAPYIQPEEIENNEKVKITDEGELLPARFSSYGKSRLTITIKLPDQQERRVNLNETSKKALVASYGDDTVGWVDKTAIIKKDKTTVDGQERIVFYLSGDK